MKIRNYNNSDYLEVVSILKDSDLFAQDQGKIIGNIFIIPYGKKVSYLFRLAVKKEFRKQGVATALIKRAEEVIKKGGSTDVGFYVDSGNINLQEFYKKRGFKISPKTYYYMWKEL